jgi:hypothetical protein
MSLIKPPATPGANGSLTETRSGPASLAAIVVAGERRIAGRRADERIRRHLVPLDGLYSETVLGAGIKTHFHIQLIIL